MGLIRDAALGAITGGMGGGGAMGALQGAAKGAAGMPARKKRPGSTDVSGAGEIPGQEEYSDEGSGEGAKRPNGKRSNGKSRL
jgi:hypothetical protein